MAERAVPDDIPVEWLDLAGKAAGGPVPDRLSEEPPSAREDLQAVRDVVGEAMEGR
jgi:hypothetical protein